MPFLVSAVVVGASTVVRLRPAASVTGGRARQPTTVTVT